MTEFDVATLMKALRHHPVPLAHVIQLRDHVAKQSSRKDFLHAGCKEREATGAALANPEVSRILRKVLIGRWPMGVAALDLWCAKVMERKPKAILEFGSGVSTLVSAILMRRLHGVNRPRVFSIEQGEQAGMDTRMRLEALGLSPMVRMHIAPVRSVCVDAFQSDGYGIDPRELGRLLGGLRPDMVLIDGPNGGHGVRFSTLPTAHSWLESGAEIWIADALRDSELSIAHWWTELGYLANPTVQVVSKGLAVGRLGDSPRKYHEASHELREAQVTAQSAEYSLFRMRLKAAATSELGINPPFQAL